MGIEQNLLIQLLLSPGSLFFFAGIIMNILKLYKTDPSHISFLNNYLLLAIGFKGGIEIQKSDFTDQIIPSFLAAIVYGWIIRIITLIFFKDMVF